MSFSAASKTPLAILLLAVVSATLVALLAGATESEPVEDRPIAAASQFAGSAPERCVFASPGLKLCSWLIEGRLIGAADPGEEALALNLICEVGIDTGFERESSCKVHPVGSLSSPLPAVSAGSPLQASTALPDWIVDATTITELSHELGEIPVQCVTSPGVQRCEWPLRPENQSAQTPRLHCELPLDGSPRRADSCRIVESEVDPS